MRVFFARSTLNVPTIFCNLQNGSPVFFSPILFETGEIHSAWKNLAQDSKWVKGRCTRREWHFGWGWHWFPMRICMKQVVYHLCTVVDDTFPCLPQSFVLCLLQILLSPKSHNRDIHHTTIKYGRLFQRHFPSHPACCNPFRQDHPGSFSPFVLLFTHVFPGVPPFKLWGSLFHPFGYLALQRFASYAAQWRVIGRQRARKASDQFGFYFFGRDLDFLRCWRLWCHCGFFTMELVGCIWYLKVIWSILVCGRASDPDWW